MGDVVDLSGGDISVTEKKKLQPEHILEAGMKRCEGGEVEEVLVIYKEKGGSLSLSGNGEYLPDTIFMLELVKQKLLEEHGGNFE